MTPYRVDERHKRECGWCYGEGCGSCGYRGWNETDEGRDEREAAEDAHADAIRKGEW